MYRVCSQPFFHDQDDPTIFIPRRTSIMRHYEPKSMDSRTHSTLHPVGANLSLKTTKVSFTVSHQSGSYPHLRFLCALRWGVLTFR